MYTLLDHLWIPYLLVNIPAPGPPEAVKVLVTTTTSLIVSWLPPRLPNGIITKYNVYVRSVDTRVIPCQSDNHGYVYGCEIQVFLLS